MDQEIRNFKIAIIDPVGIKAGLDHYDFSLARSLSEAGLPAIAYSNFSRNNTVKEVFDFSFEGVFGLRKLISDYYRALKSAKKTGVEIVIIHVFHSTLVDRFFTFMIKSLGFRLCIIVHDIENFVYRGNSLNAIAKNAEWIVVHNHFSVKQLKNQVDQSSLDKVTVIPHGHFIDIVHDPLPAGTIALEEKKLHLLFFGMIKKSKGLEILLESMKHLPSDINLVVAGRARDVDMAGYERIIRESNLRERVRVFERYISNEERNYLFKKCDMVILPYRKIFQSGNMIMAMSYRIPVIASDLPPNREIIHENNGLLFRVDDAADLGEKILELKSSERRRLISENAFQYIKSHNGWNTVAKKYKKLFE